jgi:hypothetical protein
MLLKRSWSTKSGGLSRAIQQQDTTHKNKTHSNGLPNRFYFSYHPRFLPLERRAENIDFPCRVSMLRNVLKSCKFEGKFQERGEMKGILRNEKRAEQRGNAQRVMDKLKENKKAHSCLALRPTASEPNTCTFVLHDFPFVLRQCCPNHEHV